MSSHLTYRPHEGILFGTVANQPIRVATLRNQAGIDLDSWRQVARTAEASPSQGPGWEHQHEFRSGKWAGPVQHKLTLAENAALETYDYPGYYAQRFDGVDKGGAEGSSSHPRHARVVWVKLKMRTRFPTDGFFLHGPPLCATLRCIVILQDWDALFLALKTSGQLSLAVEL